MHRATVVLGFAMGTVAVLSVAPAEATRWSVCNRTADNVRVSIAYGVPGGYTSEGTWTVRACGGCVAVFDGALTASGVFFHGESEGGGAFEGDNLFCTGRSPFTMAHANVNSQVCQQRGGTMKSFAMVNIKTANHTTNLNPSPGARRHCID